MLGLMTDAKIRLFVDHPLGVGQTVPLDRDQAHYLFGVMRLSAGAGVLLFNGHDGEWLARVAEAGKRGGLLRCEGQTRPLRQPPDLWLLFAPIKKARTDFIVEKATEMGAARIVPVQTDFTNAERIRQDRLQAHAIEAAEQCGGTSVPEVADLVRLDRLLADWPAGRQLMFCDEGFADGGAATAGASSALPGLRRTDPAQPWAILIGPEGGFSPAERARLQALPFAHAVSLGPRVLRADTAAVVALTLWQDRLGDWAPPAA
jgi:16S rRNA (uracil1498-N3)-methyltransferase